MKYSWVKAMSGNIVLVTNKPDPAQMQVGPHWWNTVSPNGILTDVVKEVQTQLLSFCVNQLFKTPSTFKT